MGAMTMMYHVDDEDIVKRAKPGDRITATVHSGDFQMLHSVKVESQKPD
jgi:Cu/Ag efflux protein CusF